MKHSLSQIIATVGPASRGKKVLKRMIEHQMDLARLNFSHGIYKEHAQYIKNIRESAKEAERDVLIIQDLSGPRVKSGTGHHFRAGAKKSLTEKDRKDLAFGLKEGIDMVAMSYVGDAKDVEGLRKFMRELGIEKPIIAKIERKKAVENLDEIIKAADAIMVARGDLANEVPLGTVPLIQKEIIKKAKRAGKPVIVATQMLLSMVENKTPTRAEVTDVTQAILDGADAVMLSEESAVGKYPAETVAVMEQIILQAEKYENLKKVNRLE